MMTALDARILGLVYTVLLTHGACSLERLMKETGLVELSARWAFFQLRCRESGGLFTLPDAMLPICWDGDIRGDNPDPCHDPQCQTCRVPIH